MVGQVSAGDGNTAAMQKELNSLHRDPNPSSSLFQALPSPPQLLVPEGPVFVSVGCARGGRPTPGLSLGLCTKAARLGWERKGVRLPLASSGLSSEHPQSSGRRLLLDSRGDRKEGTQ